MSRLNFKKKVEKRYNNSITEILKNFVSRRITYKEVSEETGFTATTVRFWCRKYNINLDCYFGKGVDEKSFYVSRDGFKNSTMNKVNVYSKVWI